MYYPRSEWGRTIYAPLLHYVTWDKPGPKIYPVRATCGLTARFWARIGIRMNDPYCPECVEITYAEELERNS